METFCKKSWTNPFENSRFFWLFSKFTIPVEKGSFCIQNIKKWHFVARFPTKTAMRKRAIFWQNPWTNPFANFWFVGLFLNFTIPVQKPFFSIQNIKERSFLARFPTKTYMRKRAIFEKKPWTNPFANFRYFWTFFKLYYFRLKTILFYPEYQKTIFCG